MCTRQFLWTIVLALGFAPAAAIAADKPKLIDEERPLQELRPLDRHTYVLTLEAEWGVPDKEFQIPRPAEDKAHYVNIFFADGGVYSHRVLGAPVFARGSDRFLDYPERVARGQAAADPMFLKGEVRCLIPDVQLIRHNVAKVHKFAIVVSMDKPVDTLDSDKIITQPIEISWPMDRPIQSKPARTRHSPPERPDVFPEKP